MTNVGYATLSVIPSAKGFGSALSRGVNPQMRGPGLTAGKLLGGGVLAGFGAAAAGIGAVFKTGLGEAMDASAGTAQLTAGIKSTGGAAGVSVKHLNNLASSIQGYSGQTDDSIVKSEQLLLTFTKIKNRGPDKIFDRATKATANMAAKMGGDASGSAIQLGKALNDPVKGVASLGRMGVQFTAGQKKTIAAMVKTGDVVGAQKVILGELETQMGGAAKAAGDSLPGKLAKAKRSFEDVSQSVTEGLLPVVLPGLTKVGTAITEKVVPAIGSFIQGFKDGKGPGGTFRDVLTTIHDKGIKPIADFITTSAVPAVSSFIDEFKAGKGPGGRLRDILIEVHDKGLVPVANFINDTVVPALKGITDWIGGDGKKGLGDFAQWMTDNKDKIKLLAEAITVVLMPVFVSMAVSATTSAATQVAAWVAAQAAGTTSAASQLASHYVIVGGWVMSAAAALASGAETVAIWAMYKAEAIAGAATTLGGLASVAAGWVATAATATASGIAMAYAWFIGLGPVGWVIGAVILVGAAFVLLYKKVKWFRDGVDAAWKWIKDAASAVGKWFTKTVPQWWTSVWKSTTEIWGRITGFFDGIPAKVKGVFSDAGSWLTDTGNNIVQGLLDGAGSLLSKIGTFFLDKVPGWIKTPFKKALGIASPSKVFHGYGRNIVEGLVRGLDQSGDKARDAIGRIVKKIRSTDGLTDARQSGLVRYVKTQGKALEEAWAKSELGAAKAREALAGMKNDRASMRESVSSSLLGALNLSSVANGQTSFTDVSGYVRGLAAKARGLARLLKALAAKGLPAGLIQQVAGLGFDDGTDVAKALLSGTGAQVKELTQDWSALQSWSKSAGSVVAGITFDTGIAAQEGLIRGLEANEGRMKKAAQKLARNLARYVREELGIHSPSTVFAQIGVFTGRGFIDGLVSQQAAASAAAANLVSVPRVASPDFARKNVNPGDGAGGRPIEVHIHPTPGMSESQVGAMAGRALSRAMVGGAR